MQRGSAAFYRPRTRSTHCTGQRAARDPLGQVHIPRNQLGNSPAGQMLRVRREAKLVKQRARASIGVSTHSRKRTLSFQ